MRPLFLLLISLALLIDVTRAEKREIGKEEDTNFHIQSNSSTCECTEDGECSRCDENGCDQVSSCNGNREAATSDIMSATERVINVARAEKREVGKEDDKNAHNQSDICVCTEDGECKICSEWTCSPVSSCNATKFRQNTTERMIRQYNTIHEVDCKCMVDGYCERRTDYRQKDWQPVKDCSEVEKYAYCDGAGCTIVAHRLCFCYNGYCMKCSANGCKMTKSCEGKESQIPSTSRCQFCDHNGCKEVPCLAQCIDDSDDNLLNEKCGEKFGYKFTYLVPMICGDNFCNQVRNCDRFATCTCDMRDDTYQRCYGYEHGTHHCRTLDKCSNVRNQKTCVCPTDFDLCKECDFFGKCKYVKECGLNDNMEFIATERKADNK